MGGGDQAGVRFARINPARARDCPAPRRLAKTDEIDARMPACPARRMAPVIDQPNETERNTLGLLEGGRD